MRRSKVETAVTRRHIISTAAERFRRHGFNGIGLPDLMAAAGLTHGGFYRHFRTREHLAAEAVDEALDSITQKMESIAASKGLTGIISTYLSEGHRDDRGSGCALASLGSEISRCDEKIRAAGANGFNKMVRVVAGQIKG